MRNRYLKSLVRGASQSGASRPHTKQRQRPARKNPLDHLINAAPQDKQRYAVWTVAVGCLTFLILSLAGVINLVPDWLLMPLGAVFGLIFGGIGVFFAYRRDRAADQANKRTLRGRQSIPKDVTKGEQ